jgi:hypothetical protein
MNKKPNLSIGFYWRKMFLFAGVFAVAGAFFFSFQGFKADTDRVTPATNTYGNWQIDLNVEKNGTITKDGQKIKDRVNYLGDGEEIRFPVIDTPGQYYDLITINLHLPKAVAKQSEIQVLGIKGVASTDAAVLDDTTIVFRAIGVRETGVVSIIAKLPRGTTNPPFLVWLYAMMSNLKNVVWISLAIVLPLLTFIIMSATIQKQMRRFRIEEPKEETDSLPMALPPAVVGALYHQKVGPREIAATIIDLAQRGNIYILDRERDFAFLKNRFDIRLIPYEKILLSKIFKKGRVTGKEEIDEKINAEIYSRKVSLLTQGIYYLATRLGYFRVNPTKAHLKYQAIGIGGLMLGLAGFLLSLKVFTGLPMIMFFWIGMMASALVIILTAFRIPIRTDIGQEALVNWLAFRKYLTNPAKVAYSNDGEDLFNKYLPYALVLDCEVEWARRFSEQTFAIPEWFVTDRVGLSLQDFCLSLFPIVSYVSRSLAAMREPGFE